VVLEIVVVLDKQHMESCRGIILHQLGGALEQIKKIHPTYDALSHHLLFLNGRCKWSSTFKASTRMILKSFVQYMLQ